jgi:putative addiction module component (TIGR02574 family)
VTEAARKILEEALALPEEERAVLVEALSDSLNLPAVELGPEWTAEINNRIRQIEKGEVRTVPWDEAEAHFQETLDSTSGTDAT